MNDGRTVLHLAAFIMYNHNPIGNYKPIDFVRWLCRQGINTKLLTNAGQTAYDIACENYGADSEIATLLETYPH